MPTFPVVEAVATTKFNNSGSITVALPAGIVSGELLVILDCWRDEVVGWSLPAGWTQLLFRDQGNYANIGAAYRIADGTEGSSIAINYNDKREHTLFALRVSSHDVATSAPLISYAAQDTTSPNPPSLSWGWAGETLVLAGAAWQSLSLTGDPSGYTNVADDGNGNTDHRVARLDTTASPEDPGAFSGSGDSRRGHAYTLAIRGASGSAGTTYNRTAAISASASLTGATAIQRTRSAQVSATTGVSATATTAAQVAAPTVTQNAEAPHRAVDVSTAGSELRYSTDETNWTVIAATSTIWWATTTPGDTVYVQARASASDPWSPSGSVVTSSTYPVPIDYTLEPFVLQPPVDQDSDGDADNVEYPELNTYEHQGVFERFTDRYRMIVDADDPGTSSGTDPRCEFRGTHSYAADEPVSFYGDFQIRETSEGGSPHPDASSARVTVFQLYNEGISNPDFAFDVRVRGPNNEIDLRVAYRPTQGSGTTSDDLSNEGLYVGADGVYPRIAYRVDRYPDRIELFWGANADGTTPDWTSVGSGAEFSRTSGDGNFHIKFGGYFILNSGEIDSTGRLVIDYFDTTENRTGGETGRAAAIAASSSLTAVYGIARGRSAAVASTSGLTAARRVSRARASAISASSALAATYSITRARGAAITAASGASATYSVTRSGAAAVSATSGLGVVSTKLSQRAAAVGVTASVSAIGAASRPRVAAIGASSGIATRATITRRRSVAVAAAAGLSANTRASRSRQAGVVATSAVTAGRAVERGRSTAVVGSSNLSVARAITRSRSAAIASTSTLAAVYDLAGSFSRVAAIYGVSTLAVTASLVARRSASVAATSSLAAQAGRAVERSATMAASAGVTARATSVLRRSAAISGASGLAATATVGNGIPRAASISATSSTSARPSVTFRRSGAIGSASGVTTARSITRGRTAAVAASASLIAARSVALHRAAAIVATSQITVTAADPLPELTVIEASGAPAAVTFQATGSLAGTSFTATGEYAHSIAASGAP